jgi:hypothetical protein
MKTPCHHHVHCSSRPQKADHGTTNYLVMSGRDETGHFIKLIDEHNPMWHQKFRSRSQVSQLMALLQEEAHLVFPE